jgi:hypothetical protein
MSVCQQVWRCAVFSLEPLAHDPIYEVMDLRPVNQLPFFLSLFCPSRGLKLVMLTFGLYEYVWAVNLVKITYVWDWLWNGVLVNIKAWPKGSVLVPCALSLCYWWSIHVLFKDIYIYIYIATRSQPEELGIIA